MAQRLRQPGSALKTDPPSYCETFTRRMARRDRESRPHSVSTTTNKTNTLPNCKKNQPHSNCAALVPTPAPKPKSATYPYQISVSSPRDVRTSSDRMHRELVATDSALVEVTVRTHTSKKKSQNNNDTRSQYNIQQPWSRLLKPKGATIGEVPSSFNDFDPLRTLHFLSKELQSRLRKNGLEDPNMQKIVVDMQQALKRIPPEVTSKMGSLESANEIKKNFSKKVSKLPRNGEMETIVSQFSESNSPVDFDVEDLISNGFTTVKKSVHNGFKMPEKHPTSSKPSQVHKSLQTSPNILANSEIFQNLLADSTKKLEKSCKDMEELCRRLKDEKEEVELLLLAEKDTVRYLRKQIQDMQAGKNEETNHKIQHLLEEKNILMTQVKKLQAQATENHTLPFEDLKSLVQQLQIEKANIEQESIVLRHELTLSNMEKEKYVTILNVRDRQINEIRGEMSKLQEVVNEQLFELQKSSFVSSPSSQSTFLGNFVEWQQIPIRSKLDKEIGDNLSMSADGSEPPLQKLFEKDMQTMHLFREVPSGDFTSISNLEYFNSTNKKNEPDTLSGKQMKMVLVNNTAAAGEV